MSNSFHVEPRGRSSPASHAAPGGERTQPDDATSPRRSAPTPAPCQAPGRCYCRACRPELHARATDPATSHAAAARATSVAVNHRNIVMARLTRPMTAYDLAEATGLTQVQICRRLPELEEMRLAHPTGEMRNGSRLWMRGPAAT